MIRPVLGGCWGEVRPSRACGLRAMNNGMINPTLFPWRPVLVHRRTPVWYSGLCTKQIVNLQCGASLPFGGVTLCADVACLAWVWWMRGQAAETPAGASGGPLLFETRSAKEAKEMDGLGWKTPRLSVPWAEKGLQCGLSGSRVVQTATLCHGVERGTASIGNGRYTAGKSNPYLSRKIYFFCCRQLSSFPKRTGCRCFWGSPFF